MSIHTARTLLLLKNRCIFITQTVLPAPLSMKTLRCCAVQSRTLCQSQSHCAAAGKLKTQYNDGFFRRSWNFIMFHSVEKFKVKAFGYYLYETVDRIPHHMLFKELALPDTMNSWFLLTELHVWMLMVKAMEFEEIGEVIRNSIVAAMWTDVAERSKKLGPENRSLAMKQTKILGEQFSAAIIGYDEGLFSNDMIMASAIWRRLFEKNCEDPEKIELMVKYVRQQLHYLDNLSKDAFLKAEVTWIPIEKIKL